MIPVETDAMIVRRQQRLDQPSACEMESRVARIRLKHLEAFGEVAITPQIIWTADGAHEHTTGERQGVSPPWKPHIDNHFQNTHQAVSDCGPR